MSAPWRFRDGWARFPFLEKKTSSFIGVTTRSLGDMKHPSALDKALKGVGLDPKRWAGGRQTHGKRVRWVISPSKKAEGSPGTDGVATAQPGLVLRVHAADCAPLFLIDGKNGALALVHAGRRGTARGILHGALRLLRRKAAARPRDLWMAVGPCIHACCYEVGPEVAAAFAAHPKALMGTSLGKRHLDLPAVLRDQALRLGVPSAHIFIAPHCTACDSRFFSFRRDGTPARCAAVMARRNLAIENV